jgi:choice-of-anchor B domain-containing protein
MKYLLSLIFVLSAAATFSQTPCENGYAGVYPCQNVDLLYHVTPESIGGATTNEVWGWTDPLDGKEYVLLGTSTGVSFYDIEIPTAPVYLGRLPTHTFNSIWRTLRTYNNYVFVGSEASGHGLQVFDLTRLRDVANPPETFTEDAYYGGFGKCHTLVISEETGYLYACGTNTYSGGLHIVNIQDPLAPVIAGGYDLNGYTHEAQVMVYNGPDADYTGHTIAFCYNGSNSQPLTIVDVTDPTDATTISTTAYPQQHYCHQGWLTEDGGYMLMDDEIDETSEGYTQTRTLIWDMHDLDNPLFMGSHNGTTEAIDHNQIIIGNLAYQSNYTAGLQIMDVSEISDTILKQVAGFDHYYVNNATSYDGQWMSYPFFESGVVPCTDIGNGLFLVQPNFIHLAHSPSVCSNDEIEIAVALEYGFVGPYAVNVNGLPGGVIATISDTNIEAPDTIIVTLSGLDAIMGNLNFEIEVTGEFYSYSRTTSVEIETALERYTDADGDGFGNSDLVNLACAEIAGTSLIGGDCNDSDATVYPGAPGTSDNVDNNCNELIDPSEINSCADLDGDMIITINDLFIFNGDSGCVGEDCVADINNDGLVSVLDLLILIADFGEVCD